MTVSPTADPPPPPQKRRCLPSTACTIPTLSLVPRPFQVYPGDADPYQNASGPGGTLHAIRWMPPSREEVSKGGFMAPLVPPPMYNATGYNLLAGGCTIH